MSKVFTLGVEFIFNFLLTAMPVLNKEYLRYSKTFLQQPILQDTHYVVVVVYAFSCEDSICLHV